MTPADRSLLFSVNLLVVQWQFAEERATLLGLIQDALPEVLPDGPVGDLIDPARSLIAARNPTEFTSALIDAQKPLVRILRANLSRAVIATTAERMGTPV